MGLDQAPKGSVDNPGNLGEWEKISKNRQERNSMNDVTQRAGLDDANPVWFQAAYPFCKDIHVQAAPFPDSLVVVYSNGRVNVRQRHKRGFDVTREAESAGFATPVLDVRTACRC